MRPLALLRSGVGFWARGPGIDRVTIASVPALPDTNKVSSPYFSHLEGRRIALDREDRLLHLQPVRVSDAHVRPFVLSTRWTACVVLLHHPPQPRRRFPWRKRRRCGELPVESAPTAIDPIFGHPPPSRRSSRPETSTPAARRTWPPTLKAACVSSKAGPGRGTSCPAYRPALVSCSRTRSSRSAGAGRSSTPCGSRATSRPSRPTVARSCALHVRRAWPSSSGW